MKLLLPILFLCNLFGFAAACTQWKAGFVSKQSACELDTGYWGNTCRDLTYKYIDYSNKNQARLGRDITSQLYCDPCGAVEARCYCRLHFWRIREWMGWSLPHIEDNDWAYDQAGDPFEQKNHENVKCD
ncbi:hypothetical protein BS50DRAFT_648740 [Corynespora cassiicola Philippines]|uniref:Avirulence Effector AvrLm4-7 domain-containing protein n=1 Tax=Corynespora cassiicola Philippines TaxID=1448308 RepID=A0A2T2NCU5_CORCC|nr:hypothetical protein BS50DRAFT_648740 [Corynespora cassiicola Philippines]